MADPPVVELVSNAKDVELMGDAEISLNAGELKIVPPEKYSVEKAGLSATEGPYNLSLGQTGTTVSVAMTVQVSVIFFLYIKVLSLLSAKICISVLFCSAQVPYDKANPHFLFVKELHGGSNGGAIVGLTQGFGDFGAAWAHICAESLAYGISGYEWHVATSGSSPSNEQVEAKIREELLPAICNRVTKSVDKIMDKGNGDSSGTVCSLLVFSEILGKLTFTVGDSQVLLVERTVEGSLVCHALTKEDKTFLNPVNRFLAEAEGGRVGISSADYGKAATKELWNHASKNRLVQLLPDDMALPRVYKTDENGQDIGEGILQVSSIGDRGLESIGVSPTPEIENLVEAFDGGRIHSFLVLSNSAFQKLTTERITDIIARVDDEEEGDPLFILDEIVDEADTPEGMAVAMVKVDHPTEPPKTPGKSLIEALSSTMKKADPRTLFSSSKQPLAAQHLDNGKCCCTVQSIVHSFRVSLVPNMLPFLLLLFISSGIYTKQDVIEALESKSGPIIDDLLQKYSSLPTDGPKKEKLYLGSNEIEELTREKKRFFKPNGVGGYLYKRVGARYKDKLPQPVMFIPEHPMIMTLVFSLAFILQDKKLVKACLASLHLNVAFEKDEEEKLVRACLASLYFNVDFFSKTFKKEVWPIVEKDLLEKKEQSVFWKWALAKRHLFLHLPGLYDALNRIFYCSKDDLDEEGDSDEEGDYDEEDDYDEEERHDAFNTDGLGFHLSQSRTRLFPGTPAVLPRAAPGSATRSTPGPQRAAPGSATRSTPGSNNRQGRQAQSNNRRLSNSNGTPRWQGSTPGSNVNVESPWPFPAGRSPANSNSNQMAPMSPSIGAQHGMMMSPGMEWFMMQQQQVRL